MTRLSSRTCRKLTQTISKRLPERYRRDDSGLTTLEWLLIVAAVAGLAALAVVLVTRVVNDTGEQIAGQSARLTGAKVAGQAITDEARSKDASDDAEAVTFWRRYKGDCEQIKIVYSDVDNINAVWESAAGTPWTAPPANEAAWDTPRTSMVCTVTP